MDIDVVKFGMQAAISIAGAFLAASLAMRKFRSEKWWEKKASAYADIVEALHSMKWPALQHHDAAIRGREISDEASTKLWEEFRIAERNVWKVADTASFLVSAEVMVAVQKMEGGLEDARNAESWVEHLDSQFEAVEACLQQVKEIGRKDLGLTNRARRTLIGFVKSGS